MPYKDPAKQREASLRRTKRWRQENPEGARAVAKRSYDKHREERCAKARKWYWDNRERAIANATKRNLKARYGLTAERIALLGNMCGICGATSDSRSKNGKSYRLAIDHDHESGKIRGLLCGNCNCGIGYFKHDEALMHKAIEYLRKTS